MKKKWASTKSANSVARFQLGWNVRPARTLRDAKYLTI
jgi:hypothetical protein